MTHEMMTAHMLDRIHDEAVKLLKLDGLPNEVKHGLDQIVALARYQLPIVSEEKRSPAAPNDISTGRPRASVRIVCSKGGAAGFLYPSPFWPRRATMEKVND
jgi:hypothetical protein